MVSTRVLRAGIAGNRSTTLAGIISRNPTTTNLQGNVFFMQSEVTGQVFADANSNSRQDRRENTLRGVEVELLDDEGTVIASTVTDRNGRYRFTQFGETGDYQIRVVPPARMSIPTTTRDVLISRGGVTVSNVNFGLRPLSASSSVATTVPTNRQTQRLAATDAAFESVATSSFAAALEKFATASSRRRNARR